MGKFQLRAVLITGAVFSLLAVLTLIFTPSASALDVGAHAGSALRQLVQVEPEITVLPENLERISWAGIIAGAILALILQLILNLLGVAIGATALDFDYSKESADAETLGMGAVIWVGFSSLLSLFAGGWVAAYFSGMPNTMSGVLHGFMTWGLVMFASFLLLSTAIGRVLGGIGGLVGQAAHLLGRTAQTAMGVAGGAVSTAGNLTSQTLGVLTQGVTNSLRGTMENVIRTSADAIENAPLVRDALENQDLTFQNIRQQFMSMLDTAGVPQGRIQSEMQATADDLRNTVAEVVRNPNNADHVIDLALRRVFRRGESVVSELDRADLVNIVAERTGQSPEQAQQTIRQWEENFNRAKEQTKQAREQAMQQAAQLRDQVEQKAQEVQMQIQQRVEELEHEAQRRAEELRMQAEHTARQSAEQVRKGVAKLATAVVIAAAVGAVAAGIGGALGAPDELPTMEVDTNPSSWYYEVPDAF